VWGGVVVASSAEAAESPLVQKVARYDRAQLRGSSQVGAGLRQAMSGAQAKYIDDAARLGRRLDTVQVSALADPTGSVVVTTAETDAVDGLDVVSFESPGGAKVATGTGIQTHETGKASVRNSAPIVGFAGVPSTSGYVLVSNGGVTVNSVPIIGGTAQYLRSEYWKYQLPESLEAASFSSSYRSNSNFFIYARRGIADARPNPRILVDLTVRSRAWDRTESRIKNAIDNAPVGSSNSCTDRGMIGFYYGAAGVEIPLSNCQATHGLSTLCQRRFEFGADWDGRTGSQQAVEAIQSIRSVAGQTPTWADYIWASFAIDPVAFGNYRDAKWSDPGWGIC